MESFLEIFTKIFAISAVRYFLVAGIPFLVFYWLLSPKFSKSKIQGKQPGKKDYIMAFIAFLVLFTPFRSYTLAYRDLSEYGVWFIFPAVLLSLVIHDTYFYWMHRMLQDYGYREPGLCKRI